MNFNGATGGASGYGGGQACRCPLVSAIQSQYLGYKSRETHKGAYREITSLM